MSKSCRLSQGKCRCTLYPLTLENWAAKQYFDDPKDFEVDMLAGRAYYLYCQTKDAVFIVRDLRNKQTHCYRCGRELDRKKSVRAEGKRFHSANCARKYGIKLPKIG